jgi:excisionase family DNA binding protein
MSNDSKSAGHEGAAMPRLLSPRDLATYLCVPLATVYRWHSIGDRPVAYRVGRHVRYKREDIEEWLRTRAAVDRRR